MRVVILVGVGFEFVIDLPHNISILLAAIKTLLIRRLLLHQIIIPKVTVEHLSNFHFSLMLYFIIMPTSLALLAFFFAKSFFFVLDLRIILIRKFFVTSTFRAKIAETAFNFLLHDVAHYRQYIKHIQHHHM